MHDVLATGLIILIIGLAVAPFFLLSSAFGAPKREKKARDRNDGPVIPTDAGGPFPDITKKPDHDGNGSDSDGGGGDGGGGSD